MNSKSIYSYLKEAKDQLDISIQSANKYLTSEKKKQELLTSNTVIEAKTDGIKITLIKKDSTGDYTKDWIVSYKGEIQYPKEFEFASTLKIKKSSIANAQFKIIFEHLKKLGKVNIPNSTEFFIEFLMKKPTLSSNYKRSHGMVLIAYSPTKYTENYGILKSFPSSFITKDREKYSKLLKIDVPLKLFEGILGSEMSFNNGIISKELKTLFTQQKSSIDWGSYDSIISGLSEILLMVESKYGGTEEGVVIKYNNKIIKFQQSYQVNQAERAKIKDKFKEKNPTNEQAYWDNVRLSALKLIQDVTYGKTVKYINFPETLELISKELKKFKLTFTHSVKDEFMIKDDIQGNVKMILRKRLKGNNNFLFLGKMRVLTKAHYSIIKKGLNRYDGGVVCIVTSAKTKDTLPLREKMLRTAFPSIEIIHHSTGNLFGIMRKSSRNINVILAGTDRASSYRDVIKNNPDLSVRETPRNDNDISASKVIENIDSKDYFIKNTPKEIHSMYDEIKKAYES